MTKYFLFNNASRAAVYGIGTFVKHIATSLQTSFTDLELCLVDFDREVREFSACLEEGSWHYRIPLPHNGCNLMEYYRSVLFLLESYLKRDISTIFHFSYNQHFDLMRLVKAKYPNVRIIYTVHYQSWCFSLRGNITRFRKLVSDEDVEDDLQEKTRNDFLEDKSLYALCDDVMVLCQFTYDVLRNDYGVSAEKLHLVRNGMPYVVGRKVECARTENKNILFVGRLDDIKGIDYTIKAFKIVSERYADVHLILVGDGDFSRYLSLCDGIWDRVTFTGKLPKEKLSGFFEHATIGVQASFHEQCSYSAMEMMAYGIPLIATDSTGLAEMMDLTPWNMVHIAEENFQEDDFVIQLANRMEALLSNSNLRKQSSEKLLELFDRRYSMKRMCKALEGVYAREDISDMGLSREFLPYIDNEMVRILSERPVIDLDNIGLTGIGCYLCWRLGNIEEHGEEPLSSKLKDSLKTCVSWILELISEHGCKAFTTTFDPKVFCWLLERLKNIECCRDTTSRIIDLLHSFGTNVPNIKPNDLCAMEIVKMAMGIYNADF